MPPVLTPEQALAYLGELSADVRAGLVLDSSGELLAGPEALAPAARDLLAALDAPQIEVRTEEGVVFAARSATHAVVVACGRFALSGLQRHDLRTVLGDLAATAAAEAA